MNCGLYLQYFGLLNILSPVSGFIFGFSERRCQSCYLYGLAGLRCIQQDIVCDGYNDCDNGADERFCHSNRNSKYCTVISAHVWFQITCSHQQIIQIDDAWFDDERHCLRNSQRQYAHSDLFRYCNNKRRCTPNVTGLMSAKIIYHCKDVDRAKQTSVLHRTTWFSQIIPNAKSTKPKTPKATIVSTSSHVQGKEANGNVSKLPATSRSSMEYVTSVKRNINSTPKINVRINNTKVLKHTFRTTHNQIHETKGKCNCSASYNPFRVSKPVTKDTIPTVNNNHIPTHAMHINKTFMKTDSESDKRKQKSQVAPIAGSVTGVMFFICLVVLVIAVRRHMVRRNISKDKDRTTKSTSKDKCREGSHSFEGQNNIPLYSSVNKLTNSELGKTMPQSISISNIGYDEVCDFNVQNEDYDHIERVGRRADVDMVYSLTTYQKTEDDYDISGNFNESLRSYQENSIYD